jgi:hypothetical protein
MMAHDDDHAKHTDVAVPTPHAWDDTPSDTEGRSPRMDLRSQLPYGAGRRTARARHP